MLALARMEPAVFIEQFRADQWWAVVAADRVGDTVVVGCDRIRDGLAHIWLHYTGEIDTPSLPPVNL